MKIIIKADTDERDGLDCELTNEGFNTLNFVTVLVGDNSFDVSVEDLFHAAKLFYDLKEPSHE